MGTSVPGVAVADDAIEGGGVQTCARQGATGGQGGERLGADMGDPAGLDAGARVDPLVRGIHDGAEVIVGQRGGGRHFPHPVIVARHLVVACRDGRLGRKVAKLCRTGRSLSSCGPPV